MTATRLNFQALYRAHSIIPQNWRMEACHGRPGATDSRRSVRYSRRLRCGGPAQDVIRSVKPQESVSVPCREIGRRLRFTLRLKRCF